MYFCYYSSSSLAPRINSSHGPGYYVMNQECKNSLIWTLLPIEILLLHPPLAQVDHVVHYDQNYLYG